jgi:isoleucyl-tRNA synthetase
MLLQDVSDPSIMISFPLLEDADGAAMVAWTTTPWTLPSNLALCVNPKFTYVKVKLALFFNRGCCWFGKDQIVCGTTV